MRDRTKGRPGDRTTCSHVNLWLVSRTFHFYTVLHVLQSLTGRFLHHLVTNSHRRSWSGIILLVYLSKADHLTSGLSPACDACTGIDFPVLGRPPLSTTRAQRTKHLSRVIWSIKVTPSPGVPWRVGCGSIRFLLKAAPSIS